MVKQIEGADFTINKSVKDENLNKLFVIEPLEFEKDVHTVNGVTDAIRCNTYVVRSADGTKYEAYEDDLIFARAMVRVLKGKIGKVVVGRLTQGQAKQGQNAPWLLSPADDKDLRAANGLIAALQVESAQTEPEEAPPVGGDTDGDEF